jgi:tetratricopeptide (TPR) repeat protein
VTGFRLDAEVGRGGQAAVWRAIHEATALPVAIKRLHEGAADGRLAAELAAVASLDHEAIVGVVDYSLADDPPWLAFEWMAGGALQDSPPTTWAAVEALARRLLAALAHAHARGVLHRDVKPDNVLLDYAGRAVLADFGLAGAATTAGTAPWKAPEQVRGAALGPAADLYGLGGTLWWCVTGEPPFGLDLPAEVYAQAHLSWPLPELLPRMPVPPGLEAWLGRLLARDPADRFGSAAAASAALGRLGAREVTPELPPSWRRPVRAVAPALAGAGLRLLAHRFPRDLGREPERDRLWRVAREVASSGAPAEVVLEGPPGSGRSHLLRWLRTTVAELAGGVVAVRAAADPPAAGGRVVTVRVVGPGEGPPGALVLEPLDPALVRAALARDGFEATTAARLAAHAHGHPGTLVNVVRALHREGSLRATPVGLRLDRAGGGLPSGAPASAPPPPELARAVTTAALLGPTVDVGTWRELAGDVAPALAWLRERRLVTATGDEVRWLDPWARLAARGWADADLLAAAAARVAEPVAAAELWLAAGRPADAVAALAPQVSRPGVLPEVVLALWEEAAALAPPPPALRVTGLVHGYFQRHDTGAADEARVLAEAALAAAGDDVDGRAMALVGLAGADAYAGRLESAWERVEAACSGPAPSAEVAAVCWAVRGQLAVRTGRWALAVPSLERAVALRVSDLRRGQTLLILARSAVMAGDLEAAASALARAEPLVPPNHEPCEVSGRLRWARGDVAGAEEALRESVARGERDGVPDQELPLIVLGRVVLDDRPDEARALAERGLRAAVAAGRAGDTAAARCVLVAALAALGAEADALSVLDGLDLAAFGRLVRSGDRTQRWDHVLAAARGHLSDAGRAGVDAALAVVAGPALTG